MDELFLRSTNAFRYDTTKLNLSGLAYILENVSEAIIAFDLNFCITYFNKSAEILYGYSADEVIGRSDLDVFKPSFLQITREDFLEQLFTSGHIKVEDEQTTKSGGKIFVESRVVFLYDDQGKPTGLVATNHDITERMSKVADLTKALQMAEAQAGGLNTIIKTLTDGLIVFERDGSIVYINDVAERALAAYKVDINDKLFDWVDKIQILTLDGKPITAEGMPTFRSLEKGEIVRDFVITRRRNSCCSIYMLINCAPILDSSGRISGAVATCKDITHRMQAEDKLRQSEESFRHLAESIPQIVWKVDPQGRIVYINDRLVEYTGCCPVDLDSHRTKVHPDDVALSTAKFEKTVRTGDDYECAYRLRRHDGEYRWVLSRAQPIRDSAGNVLFWVGTLTDIHDLQQVHEELKEADHRKDKFLAILSHELRNPLATILNGLKILNKAVPGSLQAKTAMDLLERQTNQLIDLVNDLLDVTRISRNKIRLKKQPLDLNMIVRNVIHDHKLKFEQKGLLFTTEFPCAEVLVNADDTRLAQVIGNLLRNAVKFTEDGGKINIAVAIDKVRQQAILRVSDTGIGMSPETITYLFQPFMQADVSIARSEGGLGLGLALVKRLVELHGGEVSAQSAGLGKGSEFTIHLPLSSTDIETLPVAQMPNTAKHKRRILIIDDNVDLADSLRELMEMDGHEAVIAYNGSEGLAKVRQLLPDVVLCDIGLPGLNGYELARVIRADHTLSRVYLVALTGYTQPDDLQRVMAAGFDIHLAKPADLSTLQQILAQLPV